MNQCRRCSDVISSYNMAKGSGGRRRDYWIVIVGCLRVGDDLVQPPSKDDPEQDRGQADGDQDPGWHRGRKTVRNLQLVALERVGG